jgi:peptidoglycan/xylan/chitin deacetylase (PgdA/CDA1 family)
MVDDVAVVARLRQLIARLLAAPPRSRVGLRARAALVHVLRISSRPAGIVLLYHRIGEPPGDRREELVPALGTRLFADQVRFARSCFRIVPASQLREAAATRRRGQRFPLAITFDDDLAAHRTDALPVLAAAGVPATFFLCGASLEQPYAFWWERLQQALAAGSATPATFGARDIWELNERVLDMSAADRDAFAERLAEIAGPDPAAAGMPAADVRELVAAGLEVAFHTRRHHFLPLLDDDELREAMTEGRAELAALGANADTIAYPYGGADRRVADAARAAGFTTGFTTEAAAADPAQDPLLLPRVEASFDSVGELARDVSLPLARAVLGRRR